MNTQEDPRARLLADSPVETRTVHVGGISTSVLEAGDGPSIVLLHGPGAYAAAWLKVIPGLAETHRVIAPDLPGQGASTVDGGVLDAERVLGWLGGLIERTCSSRPVLVGHLAGGAIATRFAVEHPDLVDRLVLVVPFGLAPFAPSPEFGAALSGYLARPAADTHDDLWRRCVYDLDGLRRRLGPQWELIKDYNLERARKESVASATARFVELFALEEIPPPDLARLSVPASLIWGRHDPIISVSVGESASARYGWPLHVLEQAGNEPALETPDAFLGALRAAIEAPVEVTT